MRAVNKQLTLLSEAERAALYEMPDFNYEQRLEYFTLTDKELQVALSRQSLSAKIHCILQIGYFKAVKMFFRITWDDIDPEDYGFIMQQYFLNQQLEVNTISKYEYYTQCNAIIELFGYRLWNNSYQQLLYSHAAKILLRDMNPQFITMELLSHLQTKKIIRPGYTTLQTIISSVINIERKRLADIIHRYLIPEDEKVLQALLIEEGTLSKLAAIKQDAKDFKLHMMIEERQKMDMLRSVYQITKRLIPNLNLSQQNMHYYANLINYYTVYDLRERLKITQTYLYLLCYAWKRYQQISDNLISAFCYHFKQIEDKIKESSNTKFSQHVMSQREEFITMRRLAQLYVDDTLSDEVSFGLVRQKAFSILSRDKLLSKVSNLGKKPLQEVDFYWQTIDIFKRSIKSNLRHLVGALDFSSINQENPWLSAIQWIKAEFKSKRLAPEIGDCPDNTISAKLEQYLTIKDGNKPTRINPYRYEYLIYRRLNESLKTGAIYLEDSLQFRSLSQELVSLEEKEDIIQQLNIPALTRPITEQLDDLFAELHQLWKTFNKTLRKGMLKHLHYNEKDKTLHLQKIKTNEDEQIQCRFYEQLPFCDIIDVLRFVDKSSGFLSAFTHVQPRYTKNPAKEDCLIAAIIAQAMNNGNLNMSDISNIPYAALQDTLQSRIRLATLKAANDLISNDIARMSIFPFYSFDLEVLYGGLDGQKFEAETPTIKTRYSKKYFRKGKGIVAYTLLANHVPLQTELIGANEHESYFVFDIWHNNTTEISPDIITGDMHSINRANFAIMHWFGGKLYPRFTNVETQLKHLYCGANHQEYQKYLIQPIGEIDRQLIESEWSNQQRIIATLGLKEITQSTLIRKLCTYKQEHRTRRALFEFDKLIRSIHTLKYLLDPNIQRNTHRSQNRVESYHQLRSSIAQAYGRKQLIGKTDIALEISNQCGRLIANAIIHYNSTILSKLQEKYEAEGNQKALELLRRISPVAWQHIHFHGHLVFSNDNIIDLDEIIRQLILDI
ncbi:Tn3 family transposase [Holosporaceae bacterium 'Namur']|nr:Tn3 family transposase [Holosporaceae bacterium 'Namur']